MTKQLTDAELDEIEFNTRIGPSEPMSMSRHDIAALVAEVRRGRAAAGLVATFLDPPIDLRRGELLGFTDGMKKAGQMFQAALGQSAERKGE